MRRLMTSFEKFVLYAAFVAGLGGVCVHMAEAVARQAARVANTHVASWGTNAAPSRVEQRTLEVASISHGAPSLRGSFVLPDAPPEPLHVLAAQMDRAEKIDVVGTKKVRRKGRANTVVAQRRGRSAADEFGRNFGVLLMASR